MVAKELGPGQTPEKSLEVKLGEKTISIPNRKWYKVIDDAAYVLGKKHQRDPVNQPVSRIKREKPNIKIYTVGEFRIAGKKEELEELQEELGYKLRPQTYVCDQKSFIEFLKECNKRQGGRNSSKQKERERSPRTKEKSSKPDSRYGRFNVHPQNTLQLRETSKEQVMEGPKQILQAYSIIYALLSLVNETLSKEPHNLKEFLEKVAKIHIKTDVFNKVRIVEEIMDSDSPATRVRVFKVGLNGFLDLLWDNEPNQKSLSKEEKEIIRLCKSLKAKGYDKEGAIDQIYNHFGIGIMERKEQAVSFSS